MIICAFPSGSFTAATFIDFCTKLLRDTAGPVYLAVDGHPTHRAKIVKQFAPRPTEG